MTDDTEIRKLNAIVGSALRALAESGADDEFIGAFAVSHRAKISKLLGQPEEALKTPDLVSIVQQAVQQALADAGLGNAKTAKVSAAGKGTERVYVEVAGRRTSVTIAKDTLAHLVEAKGKDGANTVIQELANSAPADVKNRSAWITDRLAAVLTFDQQESTAPGSRH